VTLSRNANCSGCAAGHRTWYTIRAVFVSLGAFSIEGNTSECLTSLLNETCGVFLKLTDRASLEPQDVRRRRSGRFAGSYSGRTVNLARGARSLQAREERAIGTEVLQSVPLGQQVVKIVSTSWSRSRGAGRSGDARFLRTGPPPC